MGYGGPQTAFYIQSDWDAVTETIRKEDNARVKAAFDREEREAQRVARIQREEALFREKQEEVRRRGEEDQALWKEIEERRRHAALVAAGAPYPKLTPAQQAARKRQKERTAQLALPKVHAPSELHNGLTYGMVMYPRPWHVDFPVGRCEKIYTPGVDRDRIVPPPKDLSRLPPWEGSYSSHYDYLSKPWQRYAHEEKEKYYCSTVPPYRTETEKRGKHAMLEETIRRIEEENDPSNKRGASSDQYCPCTNDEGRDGNAGVQYRSGSSNSQQTQKSMWSIFSHAESNGPIAATGAQHMEYSSSREEVEEHLKKYDGAMTGPSPPHNPKKYVTEMNLPELQDRIIRLQLMKKQKSC